MGKTTPKDIIIEKKELQSDPNILLNNFLKDNNLKLVLKTFDAGENPFIEDGFILTDKPLLKISVEYARV